MVDPEENGLGGADVVAATGGEVGVVVVVPLSPHDATVAATSSNTNRAFILSSI